LKLVMRRGENAFKSVEDLFSTETRAQLGAVLVEALYQTVKDSEVPNKKGGDR